MELIYAFVILLVVYVLYRMSLKKQPNVVVQRPVEFIRQPVVVTEQPQHTDIYYVPEYLKKDTMNANPIGTENLYSAGTIHDIHKPYRAWTTLDVSSTPSFYRSDFKTDMLGMKQFHDSENKFYLKPLKQGKPVYRPKVFPNKRCYVNADGVPVCDFLNRRPTTPYSLYNVNDRGFSVNQPIYGQQIDQVNGDDYVSLKYVKDKPMNGGAIYRNRRGKPVRASSPSNEEPSPLFKEQTF